MRRLPTRPDWSDDRMDAAFRARFDAEAPPPELADRVHDALVDPRNRPGHGWLPGLRLGAAPVLVAVALLSVGLGTLNILPHPAAPATGGPSSGGSSTADPGGAGSSRPEPTKVAGPMPVTFTVPGSTEAVRVLSVAEALARRATDRTGPEIVVGGWYEMTPVPCAAIQDATSDLENCAADFTWLMDGPEDLRQMNPDGSGSIHPPTGPGMNLVLRARSWTPPVTEEGPVQIVVFGHFDDRQAAMCPAGDRRTRCAALFVVDAPLWTPGGPIDLTAAPSTARGLDVQSIGEAISIRDSGTSETIAVAGWFSAPTGVYFGCPMIPASGPTWLEGWCGAAMAWLLAAPEGIVTADADGVTSMRPPTVPAIQPAFEEGKPFPLGNGLPNAGSQIPIPAVLIGHFNDPRSDDCTGSAEQNLAEARAACQARLVVESVAWVNGTALGSYP